MVDVRHVSRFIPFPRMAVYTFDSKGGLVDFSPVSPYAAAEHELQPCDFDELFKKLTGMFPGKVYSLPAVDSGVKVEHRGLEELLVNENPVNGILAKNGFFDSGVFSERIVKSSWDLVDGLYRLEEQDLLRVSVVHNGSFYDPSNAEIQALTIPDNLVKAVVSEIGKDIRHLVAVVHDLRGPLRYKGFYLNAADFAGLQRLLSAVHSRSISQVGTVTSGTISEGTNFLRWVKEARPNDYTQFIPFAVCDSLTTAVTPEYDSVLVKGEDSTRIYRAMRGLNSTDFPNLSQAYHNWNVRIGETKNSVIIDIPPGAEKETVEAIVSDAGKLKESIKFQGVDITVLTKTANTPFGTSTRLYLRPVQLADGSELTKGNSFRRYMTQAGIKDVTRRFVYFADNYASGEEISIGGSALIGVEIGKDMALTAEFGKHGVRAFLTAPNYLTAAYLVAKVIESAKSSNVPDWMLNKAA